MKIYDTQRIIIRGILSMVSLEFVPSWPIRTDEMIGKRLLSCQCGYSQAFFSLGHENPTLRIWTWVLILINYWVLEAKP